MFEIDRETQTNPEETSTVSSDEWTERTAEREYYHRGGFFIKRSLRPSEYMTTLKGTTYVPRLGKERLQNEAASLQFIRRVSNIPVPTLYGSFEVDGAYFVVTEYIDGSSMSELSEDQKTVVQGELSQHLATLRQIKSNKTGGPSGIVIPPSRVVECTDKDVWSQQIADDEKYVFCHNDLSQQNIIVDPHTLKIRAIIDWEYAGFFPQYFESLFYKRLGPSSAIGDEHDDVPELVRFLQTTEK
jgi:aminoglycoside phosphotransferase (APT) family kinase protein